MQNMLRSQMLIRWLPFQEEIETFSGGKLLTREVADSGEDDCRLNDAAQGLHAPTRSW